MQCWVIDLSVSILGESIVGLVMDVCFTMLTRNTLIKAMPTVIYILMRNTHMLGVT